MKEEKVRKITDLKVEKIRDNIMTPLLKRIRLEMMVTEREGMITANREKDWKSEPQAYNEGAFIDLTNEMGDLLKEIEELE